MLTLIPKENGWNVVAVGHWNRAIFNPQWIIGRLTHEQTLGLEILTSNPELPIRVLFENLALTVLADRLQVDLKRCEDALMQRAREVVQRVLIDLSHTPVSGVGINFRFQCDALEGRLLEVFDLPDLPALSDHGMVVQSTNITRCLKIGERILNLTLGFSDAQAIIDFNFHTPVNNAGEAIKALETDPITLKDTAVKILQQIYEATVQLEENEYVAQLG